MTTIEKKEELPEIPDFVKDMKADFAKIPSEYFAEIGRIAAAWTYLERMMDYMIWRLMSPELMPLLEFRAAACATAQIPNIARRFDALVALVRYRGFNEKLATRINRFANDTNGLSSKRNRMVHDWWSLKEGKPHRGEISAQRWAVFEEKAVDIKELQDITTEIFAQIEEFQTIANEIGKEITAKKKDSVFQKLLDFVKKVTPKTGRTILISNPAEKPSSEKSS